MRFRRTCVTLTCLLSLTLVFLSRPARSEETGEVSGVFGLTDENPVGASRFPRVTSKIAENVTVITADDIVRLNAHTLSEVLQTVPGIQLDYLRTPGSFTFFNIQGALSTTVLVLVDGVRQNDFSQNIALPGQIPVQQIDHIEIIKGAASAAWGSALGGVINIVTKSPDPDRQASGMISGSLGSRLTADSRAELSGTVERFSYYLTAGNLRSDGLAPNNGNNQNNLYSKFSYHLPGNGTVTFGLSYLSARPGLDEGDTPRWGFVHDNSQINHSYSFLRLVQPLGPHLSLELDGYLTGLDSHTLNGGRNDAGAIVFGDDYHTRESNRGGDARLTWGDSRQNLAAGVEYSHASSKYFDLLQLQDPSSPHYDKTFDRYGIYLNGAYSIGAFTLLPGVREDFTGITGNNLSYTLGATYQLAESTTLRAYAAKGFSLPMASRQNELQTIHTVQSGIETGAVPYLWLKGTYFYNTLRNSESAGSDTLVNNQDRQGFEVEAHTVPVGGLFLTSGYTFLYVTDADTGVRLKTDNRQTIPPHNVKLALNFDRAELGLSGALTGNYVWWNGAGSAVSDQGTIWDLHLNWKPSPAAERSPELFFSAHNLFNVNQTVDTVLYNTSPRWFEGGVRYRF